MMQKIIRPQVTSGPPEPLIRPDLSVNWQSQRRSGLVTFSNPAATGMCYRPDGTLAAVAADTVRIDHDPVTGAYQGVLVEEQVTNLLGSGAENMGSNWTLWQTTVSESATATPLAGVPMYRVRPTGAGLAWCSVSHNVTMSGLVTAEVLVKAEEVDQVTLYLRKVDYSEKYRVLFDLATGTVSSITGSTVANVQATSITPVGTDGFYRCCVTVDCTALERLEIALGDGVTTRATAEGLLLGLPMVYAGYPHAYVAAGTTKLADMLTVAICEPLARPDLSGTYRIRFQAPPQWDGFAYVLSIGDTTNDFMAVRLGSSHDVGVLVYSGGGPVASQSHGSVPADGWMTAVIQHDGTTLTGSVNGRSAVQTVCANGAATASAPQMELGKRGNGYYLNGHIYQVDYWQKSDFTPAQIEELATWLT